YRHVVGAAVGDQEVGDAVAVDVGDGEAGGVGPGVEAMAAVERRAELAVAQPRVDEDIVAAAVGHDQVGNAVDIDVRQLDGTGGQETAGAVAQDGGPVAVIDHDAVAPLVGEDDVGDPVAGEVGDGQGDRLVGLVVRREGAVAMAHEHQEAAVGVADEQVQGAVLIDVGDGQAGGFGAGVVGDGRVEASPAVAEVDADAVGGEDGQVGVAVVVEVG